MLSTTDHKKIGNLYLVTSLAFFMIGGAMAMFIRAELARPGLQVLSYEQYNQMFTMHGCTLPRSCSGSRTSSCRCRSARRMWHFRG
jgi:heme/copper-type cytochrome/quinol oxidase subunit 1